MTLSQLRYAITVADSRSMNQAAQKLFISQPSLSAAIRELEDEVGIEIFRRTNRGIQDFHRFTVITHFDRRYAVQEVFVGIFHWITVCTRSFTAPVTNFFTIIWLLL